MTDRENRIREQIYIALNCFQFGHHYAIVYGEEMCTCCGQRKHHQAIEQPTEEMSRMNKNLETIPIDCWREINEPLVLDIEDFCIVWVESLESSWPARAHLHWENCSDLLIDGDSRFVWKNGAYRCVDEWLSFAAIAPWPG